MSSYFWLDMLCSSAEKDFDVNVAYATIVKELRKLDLIIDIINARNITKNITDNFLLSEIEDVIFKNERFNKRLHEIEN